MLLVKSESWVLKRYSFNPEEAISTEATIEQQMVAMDLWQNSHVFKKNGKFIFLGPPGPLAVALSVCKSVTLIAHRLR